jgi:hypothetical protein
MKLGEVWWDQLRPSIRGEVRRSRIASLALEDIRAVERAIQVQLGLPIP